MFAFTYTLLVAFPELRGAGETTTYTVDIWEGAFAPTIHSVFILSVPIGFVGRLESLTGIVLVP